MPTLIGTDVAANYLVVKQSPGAALAGLDASGAYPLLTFNTPNLRLFQVVITGEDLTATPAAANSAWSKVVRALQVTSEVFAIFAPSVTEGDSTFCFMAPDFNTNTGAASVTGSAQTAITELGGDFSVLEAAIVAAVGGTATVSRVSLVGAAVV
jgi:hypothetical protein